MEKQPIITGSDKDKKEKIHHANFAAGEIATKKSEITLLYIKEFCMQDKKKAQWFLDTLKKYNKQKAAHLKIRKDFVDKYYPQFNEKPKTVANAAAKLTEMERCMLEMEAFLNDAEK